MKAKCSFCGKSQNEVHKLVFAPQGKGDGAICSDCIKVCASIVVGEDKPKIQVMPKRSITRWLIATFTSYES